MYGANDRLRKRSLDTPPLACFLILGSLGLLAGCSGSKADAPQGPPAVPVKVQQIGPQDIGSTSEYVAAIKSRHSATIMSDVEGWIFAIHVHSGDQVKPGQSLMEIDPRRQAATLSNLESQRAAKQASLQWAKVQLERTKSLFASGVTSKQDLDQAQTNYDAALADVKSLDAQIKQEQVQLHYYSVFAPVAGIVGDIPVHVGDRVTNTTALTTIDERKNLEVYLQIPTDRARDVKMGAPVEILDAAGKALLTTRINFISPQVDTSTQSVLVKAPLEQAAANKLRSQQLVRARITWGTQVGVTIPVVAVSRVSGQFFAFVAENKDGKEVARQVPLTLGEISGNEYHVIDGLKAGDRVIVSGGQNLADGMPIKIQQ